MAIQKKKQLGKWIIFLIVSFFLFDIFRDVLPEGLNTVLAIIFVIIFSILNNKAKKQWTNIKEEVIKQFTNIVHFVKENIQKSRDSTSSYKPFVQLQKKHPEYVSIKKEAIWWPASDNESYNTSTVWWKDILWRKVNPMSLNGK